MDFLAQGTIYPDVIESGAGTRPMSSRAITTWAACPTIVDFKDILEPLRLLFKDEVRSLGRELGLPEYLRHAPAFPRPWPGRAHHRRPSRKEKLDILREADAIYRDEIAKAGVAGDA